MFYKTCTPQYPLSRFIMSFWYGENAPQHLFERILPNGDIDFVMNLQDAELRIYDYADLQHPQGFHGPVVSGAQSRYYVIDTHPQTSPSGLKFRSGGASPFLGRPADQLQNQHFILEDPWGPLALELHSQLMEAKTLTARFH